MMDITSRVALMREMFLCANRLCSWCLAPDLQLLTTNSTNPQLFYDLFMTSACSSYCSEHISESSFPAILSDQIGFAWIAVGQYDRQTLTAIHLLGPMLTVEANENYLRNMCRRLRMSDAVTDELLRQASDVPTITLNVAVHYALMAYCCITSRHAKAKDVVLLNAGIQNDPNDQWDNPGVHGTWEAEQQMFHGIRSGSADNIAELAAKFSSGHIGVMCPDDPLRQAKDELICFAFLCSRAAMLGGVSPEGGYNLADSYIQKAESAQTLSAIMAYASEMYQAAVKRVQHCRNISKYSSPVYNCME